MKKIMQGNFGDVKFSRKHNVLSLKTIQSSVKIDDETISIDPIMLFSRLTLNIKSNKSIKNYLHYELAPYPLSIFTENGLRKNMKSQSYNEFTSVDALPDSDHIVHVIDGGYLLHTVVWKKMIQ